MLLPSTRRGRLALGLILLLALGARLALWRLPIHQPANDETEYLAVARDLLAGRGWRFYDAYPWLRAPLYPIYLAATLWLSGGDAQLALLPNIALGVFHVYLLWLLGRALAGGPRAERAGIWAAAGGATLLTMATFANLWMSETLWNVLWTIGLLLLLRWQRAPTPLAAALAGIAIGLTILTRSLPWLFLPALFAWMLWQRRATWPTALGHVAALALACALTIAPWTIRNWRAYGEPILVETGFSYNLWAFSEPPIDLGQINEILSAIPNPAARADYAAAQGGALLAADPTIVLRKPWTNTVYFWRVKPIEDRFLQTNYYSDVPLPYLIIALIFDDLWYVALLVLAARGVARAIRQPNGPQAGAGLALALLWIGYVVGSTMFTHGEARYRHFIWPVLLAYAGQALARSARSPDVPPAWRRRLAWLPPVAAALLLVVIAANYPWSWTGANLQRAALRWRASSSLADGRPREAEQLTLDALAAAPSPDGWIALGRIKAINGDTAGAIKAYQAAVNEKRDYPPAALALGEYLLATGDADAARRAWGESYVDQRALLDWGWRERSRAAPSRIEVGDGLDIGLIDGMYPAESFGGVQARWTGPAASLRLPGGPARILRLRLADLRPAGALRADGEARLCIAADQCVALDLAAEWRVIQVPLPAQAAEWRITLRATPWQAPGDQRELGIAVDWADAGE